MLKIPLHEENSIFLFGPRGTGKTAWLKHTLPNATYIDLLDFSQYQPLSSNPNLLEKLIPKVNKNWIIIDEVQRIPELLNEVHRLIESYRYQFILTSSSTCTLKRTSFSQGSVLNMTEMGRETGINRQVIANYFSILEDLLLSIRIPAFTKRAKRRLMNHPKFYYFDAGIYRYIRPMGPFDKTEEVEGNSLETLFLQSLRALNDYLDLKYQIYYWRTANGTEVDFVLYGKRGVHAFEIKRSKTISNKMLRGLKSFQKDYPEAKLYIIYLGTHREYHDEIKIIPFVEILKELPNVL